MAITTVPIRKCSTKQNAQLGVGDQVSIIRKSHIKDGPHKIYYIQPGKKRVQLLIDGLSMPYTLDELVVYEPFH